MCRHSLARGGMALAANAPKQRPGGGVSSGIGGLRAVPEGQLGLDFPWLNGKVWQWDTSPLMAELRGMSVSGEEWMEGGHPLALAVLSITLTRSPETHLRPLEGQVVSVRQTHPGAAVGLGLPPG